MHAHRAFAMKINNVRVSTTAISSPKMHTSRRRDRFCKVTELAQETHICTSSAQPHLICISTVQLGCAPLHIHRRRYDIGLDIVW